MGKRMAALALVLCLGLSGCALKKEEEHVSLLGRAAELEKLNAKLANPGFVNKAPTHVVEAEKERAIQLAELVAKLEAQQKGM